METLLTWGIDLIVALQQLPWLTAALLAVTWLGSEEFFLLVMPAIYWCFSRPLGARVAVVLITSNALNGLLKLALHLPRPYWVDARVRALSSETTYGLPSGHAQHALAIWGYLASQARGVRPAVAWGLALTLIGLISLSRVALGMHFPADAVGGWLVGAALLWAMWRWQAPLTAWLQRLSLAQQLLAAVLVAVVYALAAGGALAVTSTTADPAGWATTAAAAQVEPIDPRSPENAANAAGMLLGLGVGLALANRYARFEASGPWGKRTARFLIGVVGILLFWRGLALIFPAEPLGLGLALRYLRYALIVIWALFLAPWVFVKLGLADKEVLHKRKAAGAHRRQRAVRS